MLRDVMLSPPAAALWGIILNAGGRVEGCCICQNTGVLCSEIHLYFGVRMKKPAKISAAESQVMDALWRKSPLTPDQIIAAVGPANGWAGGTVRTLITRL